MIAKLLPALRGSTLAGIVLLAAAYVALGKLGLALAEPQSVATILWPPAGLAVGALLRYGLKLLPGVALGAMALQLLLADVFSSSKAFAATSLLLPLCISLGAALQAIVARWLVMRMLGLPLALQGWHDALRLLLIAGPLACVTSATCATAGLYAFGTIPIDQLATQWRTWWLGDAFGVVVFLPLMIIAPGPLDAARGGGRQLGTLSAAALLGLIVPLAVTLYAWTLAASFLHEKASATFASLAAESERALQFRMRSYEQALRGGAGFILGTTQISRTQWRAFARALDLPRNYPGMHGIGWIAAVPTAQLESYVARIQREENPEFTVKPSLSHVHAFIITYIEPEEVNRAALGLNIAFEQHRYQAALASMRTGRPTITHKLRLVQDRASRPGFLFLLPIFKEGAAQELLGWLYAPLIGEDFLAAMTLSQGRQLSVRVYDGEQEPANLIYSDSSRARNSAKFTVRKSINIGEQRWWVVWDSTASFEAEASSHEPLLILIIGLLSTTLFGAFLITATRRKQAIEQLVHDRTLQLHDSRQALQASEATLRASMEHAAIGMALVSPAGRWLEANRACCELLGYTSEELQALDVAGVTHRDDVGKDQELLQQTLAGELQSYQIERRCIHKAGHAIWVLWTVALVRDASGTAQYLVTQIQDITQRREMDRMKTEFISTVSHELRTPLTSIRGSLGLLASGVLGTIPSKAEPMVRIALTNSERLIRIINDILDIEKVESGKLELSMTSVALTALLRQSVESNQAYAHKFSVTLALEEPSADITVAADCDRLMQVMANLLSNAAKFSPPGSRVMVRAIIEPQVVRIEVQDFGQGIPESFRRRIFEKFVQADSSTSRRFEGTGLGLSITKQLVEAMGGTIDFTSQVGGGTTFRVLLKRALTTGESLETAHLQTSPNLPASNVPKVLHVEDNQDLSRVIQASLVGRAHLVRAGTLAEARQQLSTGRFALLLVDLSLPDGDGSTLVEEYDGDAPIILLSVAEPSPRIRYKVFASLTKSRTAEPVIIEQILAAIAMSQHEEPGAAIQERSSAG
jgi:PAS domain S-box-containing protein